MKYLVLASIVALAAGPLAAEETKAYSLDGGALIDLPSGWNHKQVVNPAMKMPSVRDMMVGASETRMKRGNTGILVSYMHFKSDKPAKTMDEAELASVEKITHQAAGQYLRSSVETEVTPRSEIVGTFGVSLATLTARDGASFNVAPGYSGSCVTTGSVREGAAVWAVSIASDSCGSQTHAQAVEAFFNARSD